MKRILAFGGWIALLLVSLTGCLFGLAEDLYRLPEGSPGYEDLTQRINEVRSALEREYSAVVEYAQIYSGEHISTVQLQDLDGDGQRETAVTFFRLPGAERPLRIFFFTLQPDESYRVTAALEGDGAAINAVDYVDLNGEGLKEVVVSWQVSSGVYQLGVYSLDERMTHRGQSGLDGPAVPPLSSLLGTELLSTNYSDYKLIDLDEDTQTEVAVVRLDQAGENSTLDLYGWGDDGLGRQSSARLSNGITALRRVRTGYVAGELPTPAIYVTSDLIDGAQAVDILAWRGNEVRNVVLDADTGVSRERLRLPEGVDLTDINGDAVLEIPHLRALPSYGENAGDFWLTDWEQYDRYAECSSVCTTYHNIADGWYLEIPDHWRNRLTISRNDVTSGQRAVIFSLWNDAETEPTRFLVLYKLTGVNRATRATTGDRFILWEDANTIYSAAFYASGWDCGLDEAGVRERFHLILPSWSND